MIQDPKFPAALRQAVANKLQGNNSAVAAEQLIDRLVSFGFKKEIFLHQEREGASVPLESIQGILRLSSSNFPATLITAL